MTDLTDVYERDEMTIIWAEEAGGLPVYVGRQILMTCAVCVLLICTGYASITTNNGTIPAAPISFAIVIRLFWHCYLITIDLDVVKSIRRGETSKWRNVLGQNVPTP